MIKIPPPWNDIDSLNEPSFHANKKFCEEDLARSGLTTSDMPVFSEPFAILTSQFASGVPLVKPNSSTNFHYYTIPYYNIDGTPIQDKTGRSKMYRKRTTDKEHRYISPLRSLVGDLVTMPYFNPLRLEKQCDKDLYVIVEGEKKYSKLLKEVSLYGCAIGGKDMWQEDGKVHPMLLEDILAYAPKEVRIVPDGDWRRQDIFASYSMLIFKLRERLGNDIRITVADLSGHRTVDGDRVGIDDYLHAGKDWGSVDVVDPEHELLLSAGMLVERYALDVDPKRDNTFTIRQNHSNVEKLLRQHPLFSEDQFWFDMDTDMPQFGNSMENIYVRLLIYLQRYCHLTKLGYDILRKTAPAVFHERVRSPLLEKVKSLKWDNTDHLRRAMTEGFQTDREHEAYRYEAVKRIFMQAVARKDKPGCKADTVVVLMSDQGKHKSMLWELLSYGSYMVVVNDPNDRDMAMRLHGKWFSVFEEMEWPSKVDEDKYKRVVTQTEDYYRAPYGEFNVTKKRHNIFVGNTNNEKILRGAENRREMPIWVSNIDLDWFIAHRDQLFAQAWAMYQAGEKWWSEDESEWEEAKSEYREDVPHQVAIENVIKSMMMDGGNHVQVRKGHQNTYVAGRRGIELSQLAHLLGPQVGYVGPKAMGNWLRRLGYEMRRVSLNVGDDPRNVWFKKEK